MYFRPGNTKADLVGVAFGLLIGLSRPWRVSRNWAALCGRAATQALMAHSLFLFK